jgi:formate--tetrahydrofolate ligase
VNDLELSRSITPRPIIQIGEALGLHPEEIIPYGRAKAKISLAALNRLQHRPFGRYVLVTAINPTPLGEGKTTTTVGLAMGLCRLGKRAIATLRQPSLGPVFGIKGGGTGGGRAQVIPMEDINLHLTGDAHAVSVAHNLLSAFIDNSLFHGNRLDIDPMRITWPRAMGMSDRALREVELGRAGDVAPHRAQFVITEASEVMAILALASSPTDLRQRLSRILVGFTSNGTPVTADELGCVGGMAALLKDALSPNLLQTMEGTPAFIHTGPFGNIAHGNSSIVGDAIALRCGEYVITEAGFGSDLGAEKFFNIKCRMSGFKPDAAVVVATLRALKLHGGGGVVKTGKPLPVELTGPNQRALSAGLANLAQHMANVRQFGVPVVVAVNAFKDDPRDELDYVKRWSLEAGATAAAVSTHWADGGQGAEELARAVVFACTQPSSYAPLYSENLPIKEKIEIIAKKIYGAGAVRYEGQAETQIETATKLGLGELPICMAKTPLSLSHDPQLIGRPTGFTLPIKELRILAGAGFLTAVCSGIQLMPGLPTRPVGEKIDVDPQTGEIVGL